MRRRLGKGGTLDWATLKTAAQAKKSFWPPPRHRARACSSPAMEEVLYKGSSDAAGRPNGQGLVTFESGDVYEGEWEAGTPHGYGKMRYADGDVFIGNFADGAPYGAGTLIIDGNEYAGDFKNNGKSLVPHGRGIMKYADGNVYSGDFVNGQRDGVGENKYVYGAVYEGPWAKDERHGMGRLRFPNGTIFEGFWQENERGRRGTLWLPGGEVQCVLFNADGRPVGDGVMWSADRRSAWRMRGGKQAEAISIGEAATVVSTVVSLPIPYRQWWECCSGKPA